MTTTQTIIHLLIVILYTFILFTNAQEETTTSSSSDHLQYNFLSLCGDGSPNEGSTVSDEMIPIQSITSQFGSIFRKEYVAALPSRGDTVGVKMFENETVVPERIRCSIRMETCSNCLFEINFIPPIKYLYDKEIRMISKCMDAPGDPCFDLRIVEEKADTSFDVIYSTQTVFDIPGRTQIRSSGQSIRILMNMWNIDANSSLSTYIENFFPFTVTAITTDEYITGQPSESLLMSSESIGFIESPRYPSAYPRSVEKSFFLENRQINGFIRLIFDDFHIHFQSELRIEDSDGVEIVNTKRDQRRPPAIVSRGNKLKITFIAHDFTQLIGFRGRYEFVEEQNWPDKPNSRDCDEFLEGYGGEIRLDGHTHLLNTYVDCIWIIGRLPAMSRTFDRIYLKVEDFNLKGIGLRLEIREGASSTSDRLLLLFDAHTRDQLEQKQPHQGFSTSLSTPAYYIRMRGYLMGTSGLEIVFSQFYRWATALCPGLGEWHCENARCIKSVLRCDGVDHCGDGSDEMCQRPEQNDFITAEHDVSGLLALVIGVCGLIVLLISSTAVITRYYRRRLLIGRMREHIERGVSSPYPTESLGPSIQTVGERRFYVLPERNVSVIEAPPSYDDAMKHPQVDVGRSPAYVNPSFDREDIEDSPHLAPAYAEIAESEERRIEDRENMENRETADSKMSEYGEETGSDGESGRQSIVIDVATDTVSSRSIEGETSRMEREERNERDEGEAGEQRNERNEGEEREQRNEMEANSPRREFVNDQRFPQEEDEEPGSWV